MSDQDASVPAVTINNDAGKPQSVRDVLNIIKEFLETSGQSAKLWRVLTALRGPDIEYNYPVKADTTAVIRTAAFGGGIGDKVGASFYCGPEKDMAVKVPDNLRQTHFFSHIVSAAETLGLGVRELIHNVDVTPNSSTTNKRAELVLAMLGKGPVELECGCSVELDATLNPCDDHNNEGEWSGELDCGCLVEHGSIRGACDDHDSSSLLDAMKDAKHALEQYV